VNLQGLNEVIGYRCLGVGVVVQGGLKKRNQITCNIANFAAVKGVGAEWYVEFWIWLSPSVGTSARKPSVASNANFVLF
jgi:hypothetical protein